MQEEKKRNNDGYITVHNVNKNLGNNYVSSLSFFYPHLAKNVQLQLNLPGHLMEV